MKYYISGKTTEDFQSTFKRRASIRKSVMDLQVDLTPEVQSIRMQTIAREKKKLLPMPALTEKEYSRYKNQKYFFLDELISVSGKLSSL